MGLYKGSSGVFVVVAIESLKCRPLWGLGDNGGDSLFPLQPIHMIVLTHSLGSWEYLPSIETRSHKGDVASLK